MTIRSAVLIWCALTVAVAPAVSAKDPIRRIPGPVSTRIDTRLLNTSSLPLGLHRRTGRMPWLGLLAGSVVGSLVAVSICMGLREGSSSCVAPTIGGGLAFGAVGALAQHRSMNR